MLFVWGRLVSAKEADRGIPPLAAAKSAAGDSAGWAYRFQRDELATNRPKQPNALP